MTPKVSILLPIRNEERWLAQTLKSIQDQDFADFEVLISDNASTDKTAEIYTPVIEADPRFRLFKHDHDIGAFNNFTFALTMASGEYILFAGGHDLFSRNYITALKSKLDTNKEINIAFGTTSHIDEYNQILEKKRGLYSTEGVQSPVRRFNIYMWADQNPLHGLTRKKDALETFPTKQYVVGGQIYLQRMAIRGQFAYVPEAIFFRRQNRPQEASGARLKRYSTYLFKENINVRISFWKSAIAIMRAAAREPLAVRKHSRKFRVRFQLIATSITSLIRFWSYLW